MNAMSFRLFGSARRLLMIMPILFAPVAACGENLLASGDVLEIEAVGFRDFRQDMIDLNGQASFPLIGDIKAPGKLTVCLTVCLDILRDIDIGSVANHFALSGHHTLPQCSSLFGSYGLGIALGSTPVPA
jgi:hypothetical protein